MMEEIEKATAYKKNNTEHDPDRIIAEFLMLMAKQLRNVLGKFRYIADWYMAGKLVHICCYTDSKNTKNCKNNYRIIVSISHARN